MTINLSKAEISLLICTLDAELEHLEKFGHPSDDGHREIVSFAYDLRSKLQRTLRPPCGSRPLLAVLKGGVK